MGNISTGWHNSNGHRVLVFQNPENERWVENNTDNNMRFWIQLQRACVLVLRSNLQKLDHIVFYVDPMSFDLAINLADYLPIPTSKITLVGCICCSATYINAAMNKLGITDIGQMLCEHEGQQTMKMIFDNFLRAGELLKKIPT